MSIISFHAPQHQKMKILATINYSICSVTNSKTEPKKYENPNTTQQAWRRQCLCDDGVYWENILIKTRKCKTDPNRQNANTIAMQNCKRKLPYEKIVGLEIFVTWFWVTEGFLWRPVAHMSNTNTPPTANCRFVMVMGNGKTFSTWQRNNTIIFSLQESVVQSSSQCLSHIHLLKIFPDMVIDRWSRMCTCLL